VKVRLKSSCVCTIEPNSSESEDLEISFKVSHLALVPKLSLRDTWVKFITELDDLFHKSVHARLCLKFISLATCHVHGGSVSPTVISAPLGCSPAINSHPTPTICCWLLQVNLGQVLSEQPSRRFERNSKWGKNTQSLKVLSDWASPKNLIKPNFDLLLLRTVHPLDG
jgi:hypothetical protein